MLIVTLLYVCLVYLLFFKFKVLPWNKISQGIVVLVGTVILSAFLVGLQGLTPSSSQATVTGRIVEIAPAVQGRIVTVDVRPNESIGAGDILFTLDEVPFRVKVDELRARLRLSRLRVQQYEELAKQSAGSEFQLEQAEAETEQLEALLEGAEFDLSNTVVRAPADGIVPRLFLQPGMRITAFQPVMTFVDTSRLSVVGQFQQKALRAAKAGDTAYINFPSLPGQVFESRVIAIPSAIGDAQAFATGQLPEIGQVRMTRDYPVYIAMPEEFPEELHKVGLAATVYIHTESAGVVGIVARILQWIATSLDAIT